MSSPYKVRHKPSRKTPERTKFLALLTLFSLILVAFIYVFMLRQPTGKEVKNTAPPYPAIHAEDLGKTPGILKKKYPDLFLSNDRYGMLVGKHKLEGATYYIWFVAENREKVAFRIKAVKNYPSLEEKDVLAYFGSFFGRPFDGQCSGRTTYALDNCHFKWWVKKTVSLDLYSRYTSKKQIMLSAITTDTYLTTKHHKKVKAVLPTQ